MEAEDGPGPSRLHLIASAAWKALCLEWLEVIRQAPAIKQDTQQQLGRVTLGPPLQAAGRRQCPGTLLSEEESRPTTADAQSNSRPPHTNASKVIPA